MPADYLLPEDLNAERNPEIEIHKIIKTSVITYYP